MLITIYKLAAQSIDLPLEQQVNGPIIEKEITFNEIEKERIYNPLFLFKGVLKKFAILRKHLFLLVRIR